MYQYVYRSHFDEMIVSAQAIMDRERQDELPGLQLEWIDGVCLPLYRVSRHRYNMCTTFEY